MRLSRAGLMALLRNNAVELRFTRRKPRVGDLPHRRMLATNDVSLLNSSAGRTALNFRPATGRLKFSPAQKNLIVVWDIFMQDYRLVPAESADVVSVIPTSPPEKFWEYFSKTLTKMSAADKERFMDK